MADNIKKSNSSVIKYIYRDIFLPGCAIFAVVLNVLMLMFYTVYDNPAIASKNVFFIFAFSMTYALTNLVFKLKNDNFFLKIGLHFVLSVATIAFYFLILNRFLVDFKTSAAIIFLVIYVALYLLVLPFLIFFNTKAKKKQNEQKEYTSIYKK